jgi:MraZ protein
MFLGMHHPRLDDKGRLVLPAKYREALVGGVVLSKGQDRALVLWPAAEFAAYAERLNEASRNDANVRAYTRVFFSGASDESPDRQGRVTIPPALREYAGLERDVVIVGAGQTCEIWAPSAWDTYLNSSEPKFADLNQEVVPGLF